VGMSVYCDHCGKRLSAGAQFRTTCGSRILPGVVPTVVARSFAALGLQLSATPQSDLICSTRFSRNLRSLAFVANCSAFP
jgi:N-acyl-L-homoserine lactone synthetase